MQTNTALQFVQTGPQYCQLLWANSKTNQLANIFLRDNCPCCLHANGQKLLETADLSLSVAPAEYAIDNERQILRLVWATDGHTSEYPFAWLLQHGATAETPREGRLLGRPENAITLWDAELNNLLPGGKYPKVAAGGSALAQWLGNTVQYGFSLLDDVPVQPGTVVQVAELFGYIRQTNYGRLFDVKSVVNPNNLAYTGLAISPHTDNPYRQPVPTLQLLHCLSSSAQGGDSILVDGFKVAADLAELHPHYYYLLHTTPVTFSFRDNNNWLLRTTTIIELDTWGNVVAVNFNNRSIQPFRLDAHDMVVFYDAYLTFARMLAHEKYQVRFTLRCGQLYMVNNRRVLHARTAFTNAGGERWLQGTYADIDGLLSTWRVLDGDSFRGYTFI